MNLSLRYGTFSQRAGQAIRCQEMEARGRAAEGPSAAPIIVCARTEADEFNKKLLGGLDDWDESAAERPKETKLDCEVSEAWLWGK